MPGRYLSSALLDNFGSGLGNWSTWRTGAPLVIVSGALANNGVNFRCGSYYSVKQFGPAVEATATLSAFGSTATDEIDISLRVSTADPSTASFYNFVIGNSTAGGSAINYYNAGVYVSTLASNLSFNSWAAGDIVTVQAIGSSLTIYRNGVVVITGTDTNITAAGWIAVEITNTAATDTLDNLYGGTVIEPGKSPPLQAVNRSSVF